MTNRRKKILYFIPFVLPTLIAFMIAFVIPFFQGIYLSFCKFTTVNDAKWVGLENYEKIFKTSDFTDALWFTTKFTVVSIITVNVFAFLLALALTRKVKGTNIFRTIFFMPNLIGGIVLGYIWQAILNSILNNWDLTLVGNADYGFWGLVIIMNWQMIGYMMIIYIAGIQNVPADVLEAAKIDGATPTQTLFRITIPLVMPSFTICLFLTLSNSFKMFDQNLALTDGKPGKETMMLAYNIHYTMYTRNFMEGVAQAKAVIFFIIVAVIGFAQLVLTRSKEVES
ncbi:MAG: sugar ABC transporter permease [Lachnospiraceae bacterium]|nr:sugar ABC transporter permease [Lachnospiraceae bacterium]MBQ4068444.1 sugar ABC transporter permease [Lachnospiraceae bacterium]